MIQHVKYQSLILNQGVCRHPNKNKRKTHSVTNAISIDSLKLRIPLSLVQVKDPIILDHVIEVNERTGEIDPETYKRKFKEYNLTETSKVKLGIETRTTAKGVEECLMIYVNSKILQDKYFNGITFDNSRHVYDTIQGLNVVVFSYEVFMRSDCTDIDLKLDETMSQDEWNELLKEFQLATIPTKESDKGFKRFKPTKKDPYQNGLQYNSRARASASRPFLKLYWKGGELKSKSNEFRSEHLAHVTDHELSQIVRIETTIKDKRHAKLLGVESTTFLSLLSITENTKEDIFRKMLSKYLEKPKRQIQIEGVKETSGTLSPIEHVMYCSLVSLLEHTKDTPENVINALIQTIPSKVSKSRKKSELNLIYERHVKGSKVDLRNAKINSFFAKFGWT